MMAFSPPLASEHVRELWPLFPHCEHVRDIFFTCVETYVSRKEQYEKKGKAKYSLPQSMQESEKKKKKKESGKVFLEYWKRAARAAMVVNLL